MMGRDHPYSIAFEGGLGSQVMSYIDLFYCKLLGLDYRLNFDYFNLNKEVKQKSGLTHWKWELDNYGIELEQIIIVEKNLYKKRKKSASIKKDHEFWTIVKHRVIPIVQTNLPINSCKVQKFAAIHIEKEITET